MSQVQTTPNVLTNAPCHATIGCTDINASRAFYSDVLGLNVVNESGEQGILFEAGGTSLYVYPRPGGHTPPENTVASFTVSDVAATVAALSANGVTFEPYDLPGLQTNEAGIATIGDMQSAWFKDPDGNILAIGNL